MADEGWMKLSPSLFHLSQYTSPSMKDKDFSRIEKRERAALLNTLEEIKATEPNVYRLNQVYQNVHCYLLLRCFITSYNEDDLELFEQNINKDNHENLIALQLQLEALSDAELKTSKGEGLKQTLEEHLNTQSQAVAKAEIAFYLYHLDHRLYQAAAELLESCLNELPPDSELFWTYELGTIYNRMLNKDFWMAVENLDKDKIFYHAQDCFEKVISQSPKKSPASDSNGVSILAARARVDLADALNKSDLIFPASHSSKLMEEAMRIFPNDPHVQERYGRYLRNATKRKGGISLANLKRCVEVLEDCVNRHPKRHVALHQLALAYQEMWLKVNTLPQRGKRNQKQTPEEAETTTIDLTTLRAYNYPKTENTTQNELLEEAKKCMQKAKACVKSSIYIVELARIHMSLGEVDAANKCLDQASRNKDSMYRTSRCDDTMLYEQLGLFHYQQKCENNQMKETKDIKIFLRFAVERAAFARTLPFSAYRLLWQILQDELKETPVDDQMSIKLELAYMSNCMGLKPTTDNFANPDTSKLQPEDIGRLVDLLKKKEQFSDAYSVLFGCCMSGELDLHKNAELLIELACKAATERQSNDNVSAWQVYRDVFKLLDPRKTSKSPTNPGEDYKVEDSAKVQPQLKEVRGEKVQPQEQVKKSPTSEKVRYQPKDRTATKFFTMRFLLLVDDGNCPLAEHLFDVLSHTSDTCEVIMDTISTDGFNDFPLGCIIPVENDKMIEQADIVLGYAPQQTVRIEHIIHSMLPTTGKEDVKKLLLIKNDQCQYPNSWSAVSSVQIPACESASSAQEATPYIMKEIMRKWMDM